jgi:hypothetical protein
VLHGRQFGLPAQSFVSTSVPEANIPSGQAQPNRSSDLASILKAKSSLQEKSKTPCFDLMLLASYEVRLPKVAAKVKGSMRLFLACRAAFKALATVLNSISWSLCWAHLLRSMEGLKEI